MRHISEGHALMFANRPDFGAVHGLHTRSLRLDRLDDGLRYRLHLDLRLDRDPQLLLQRPMIGWGLLRLSHLLVRVQAVESIRKGFP